MRKARERRASRAREDRKVPRKKGVKTRDGGRGGVRTPWSVHISGPRRAEERHSIVRDVLFLAIIVAFFAIAVVFVHACERIIGPDTEVDTPADAGEPERAAA